MSSPQLTPQEVREIRLKKRDSGAGKRVFEDVVGEVQLFGKGDRKQEDQKPLSPVVDLTGESSSAGSLPAPKKAKTTSKVPSTNTPLITSIDINDIWVSVTKTLKKRPIVGSENMMEMLKERCNDNLACKDAFKDLIKKIEDLYAKGLSNVEEVCQLSNCLKDYLPARSKNIISWSVYKATWIPQFHDAVSRGEFSSGAVRAGCWGWWLATAPARALAKRKGWDIILEDLISMGFYPHGTPANGVLTPGFVLYDREYRIVAVEGKSTSAAAINWTGCIQYYENLAASTST